jgi:tetratricopeptide (TPR) repeat protein
LADFAQAIHIDANLAEAYGWQGLTYAYLKQGAQALVSCNQAIELQPENATFLHIRGVVHRILNQFEQALADLNQAGALAPDNAAIERDKRSTLLKCLLVGDPFVSEAQPSAEQLSVVSPSASLAPQKRRRRPASTKQGQHHKQQYAFFS